MFNYHLTKLLKDCLVVWLMKSYGDAYRNHMLFRKQSERDNICKQGSIIADGGQELSVCPVGPAECIRWQA